MFCFGRFAVLFWFVAGAKGVAYIFGPAIGGLLAQPAVHYPSIFASSSVFARSDPPLAVQIVTVEESVGRHPTLRKHLLLGPLAFWGFSSGFYVSPFFLCNRARYPYLLPNLIGAVLALITVPLVIVILPESKHADRGRRGSDQPSSGGNRSVWNEIR